MTGGAKNHRYNLSDAAMLKDNHIDAAGGITAAITKLRSKIGHMTKIEVETRNLDELQEALDAKADIIMLDNMSPELMKKAVEITNKRAVLEASGGITDETLRAVAESGVDIISVGALTTKNLLKIPHCVRNDILHFIIVRIFFSYIELTLFLYYTHHGNKSPTLTVACTVGV